MGKTSRAGAGHSSIEPERPEETEVESYEQPDHHGEKKLYSQLFKTSFQILYCLTWLFVLRF